MLVSRNSNEADYELMNWNDWKQLFRRVPKESILLSIYHKHKEVMRQMNKASKYGMIGVALSLLVLSVVHAYAYHEITGVYSNSPPRIEPTKYQVSVTGTSAGFKSSNGAATVNINLHTWNVYSAGSTYAIEDGKIKIGNAEYAVDHGVLIGTKYGNEFLIIMKDARGQLIGKIHGHMNGGLSDFHNGKAVQLIIDSNSKLQLSTNDNNGTLTNLAGSASKRV